MLPEISSSPKSIKAVGKLRYLLVFLNHKNLFCFCWPNVRIWRTCQDAWLLGKWPFLFRNWAFGYSADTKVRSLFWDGGLNSPALTVFSRVMGMITPACLLRLALTLLKMHKIHHSTIFPV